MQFVAIGSDPESFLEDKTGKVISAIGRIGGTKDEPLPVPELGKGFYVQEDNVLLEYNTPPAKSASVWRLYHRNMREYLKELVGQQGLVLSNKASHCMDKDQLDHPKAFVFGCDPDFDAWAMKWNAKPKAADPTLRSGGGHVHVAYTNPNAADSIRIARALDYWIGAPLARLDPDKRRRELYGKAGAIRFKPYGLEYRTPSNWWTLSEQAIEAIYYNVQNAIQFSDINGNHKGFYESAQRFLAGEDSDFNSVLFDMRGHPYGEQTEEEKPKLKQKYTVSFDEIHEFQEPLDTDHPDEDSDEDSF